MNKARVEQLSDGIISIIITVMIFNLKTPLTSDKKEFLGLVPQILSYFESFFLIGIFWYKHNRLLESFQSMNRKAVCANHFFLFCLSLIPFVTSWSTQSPDIIWPRFFYGVALLACFLSFFLLQYFFGQLNKRAAVVLSLGNLISITISLYSPWLAYFFFGILGIGYLISDEGRSSINEKSTSIIIE